MDVAAWLRDLGLERYVSAFRDNDIDATRVVQARHCRQIRAGEMVGDYRRAQRNGRAVADAIGERKKGQGYEPHPDCPSEKQHAQRNVNQSKIRWRPSRSAAWPSTSRPAREPKPRIEINHAASREATPARTA
jgi:SAM domain (Sterile alpha motif)